MVINKVKVVPATQRFSCPHYFFLFFPNFLNKLVILIKNWRAETAHALINGREPIYSVCPVKSTESLRKVEGKKRERKEAERREGKRREENEEEKAEKSILCAASENL